MYERILRNLRKSQRDVVTPVVLRRQLLIITGLLLFIAFSRVLRLNTNGFHKDEIWSVWQTFGSPTQIIGWTPWDWGPLYYLFIGLWKELVGLHPIALRTSSSLFSIITAAFIYRLAQKQFGYTAACLGVLAYGALGFSMYFSGILRAYALLELVGACGFWLMLRYFERPVWRRMIPLVLSLSTLIYIQLSGVFMIAFMGLFSLVVYPRKWSRWVVPLVLTLVVCLPILPRIFGYASTANPMLATNNTLVNDVLRLLADYAGTGAPLLLIIAVAAGIMLFWRNPRWRVALVLSWWATFPLLLGLNGRLRGFFYSELSHVYFSRYFWWVAFSFVLWVGWGLSRLTVRLRVVSVLLLSACILLPLPSSYQSDAAPYVETFGWLAKHARWGDVLLIDKSLRDNHPPYEWEYIVRTFMPNGIQIVDAPGAHRRVWFAGIDTWQDPQTRAAVEKGRIAEEFVGPWNFLIRLYEGPPEEAGIRFENGMRFHGMDLLDTKQMSPVVTFLTGESVRVRLWWSVDEQPKLDYSVGVYMISPLTGRLLLNSSSAPQTDPKETSQWQPGRFYIEERTLILPVNIKAMEIPVTMSVYQSWDNTRIAAPEQNKDKLLTLLRIDLQSWEVTPG